MRYSIFFLFIAAIISSCANQKMTLSNSNDVYATQQDFIKEATVIVTATPVEVVVNNNIPEKSASKDSFANTNNFTIINQSVCVSN